jgi:alpha-glucan,water dikinase
LIKDVYVRGFAAHVQVISPGQSIGRVVLAKELHPIQDKIYEEATVLIVDAVSGEEEIPQGVTAVLTRSAPDVLSHVSVRARNMGCLLASCYDGRYRLPLHL